MTTLGSLLIKVGVQLDGALKVEQRLRGLKGSATAFGTASSQATTRAGRAFAALGAKAQAVGKRIETSMKGAIERVGGLGNAMMLGGAAVAGAAVATFKFVDAQTAKLDAINKSSRAVGVGVEELQRLTFAATQSGVAEDTLTKGLRFFNQTMLDMAGGGGKLATEALQSLGLGLDDLKGKSRTEQIGLIGDRLNNVADEGERAALAARLFGTRAGPQMATMLSEGTDGLNALAASAQGVFSQEDADRATRFQDLLGETKNVLSAVGMEVAMGLLPAVQDAVAGFKEWIQENDDFIKQGMPTILDGLSWSVTQVGDAVSATTKLVNLLGSAFDGLSSLLGDDVHPALDGLGSDLLRNLSPIHMTMDAVEGLTDLLVELDVVSRTVGSEIGSAAGAAARGAAAAAREMAREQAKALRDTPIYGPDERLAGGGGRKASAPRARGGGGGGARKAAPPKAQTQPGVTVEEATTALLSGSSAVLSERLRGMSSKSPSTRDVKPTVAMDITINNNTFDIDVSAADPSTAGKSVIEAVRAEFRRTAAQAGQALSSGVVR